MLRVLFCTYVVWHPLSWFIMVFYSNIHAGLLKLWNQDSLFFCWWLLRLYSSRSYCCWVYIFNSAFDNAFAVFVFDTWSPLPLPLKSHLLPETTIQQHCHTPYIIDSRNSHNSSPFVFTGFQSHSATLDNILLGRLLLHLSLRSSLHRTLPWPSLPCLHCDNSD